MTEEKGNTPVYKVRAGSISVDVWENENEKNGQKFKSYTLTTTKNYKAKDGEWKESKSLQTAEVPKLMALLSQAYSWMISQKTVREE